MELIEDMGAEQDVKTMVSLAHRLQKARREEFKGHKNEILRLRARQERHLEQQGFKVIHADEGKDQRLGKDGWLS